MKEIIIVTLILSLLKKNNEVPNRVTCLCFERQRGVQKCRWNKKPKCVVQRNHQEVEQSVVFR